MLKSIRIPDGEQVKKNRQLNKLERLFPGRYLLVGNQIIHNEEGERKNRLERLINAIKN